MNRFVLLTSACLAVAGCASLTTTTPTVDITSIVNGVKLACGFQPELAAISLLIGAGMLPSNIIAAICAAANKNAMRRAATPDGTVVLRVHGVIVHGRYVR